jgi:hypothetical protein
MPIIPGSITPIRDRDFQMPLAVTISVVWVSLRIDCRRKI